jgi:hypothetical protein
MTIKSKTRILASPGGKPGAAGATIKEGLSKVKAIFALTPCGSFTSSPPAKGQSFRHLLDSSRGRRGASKTIKTAAANAEQE